ncbi:MAG: diacylglycerol kinase family lipid kinase [Clostridiales bacterium]|nr:diacylglycerol kinase family lipid kinase [Clostridiales bacterium]
MYALIVNPVSGNGRGMREYPRVEALLREEGIPYRLSLAEERGSVRAYAAEAVRERMDGIIAVGGDGTLFEIINGMAGSSLALLFVCCGTGNDFVKSLNLPKEPIEALRQQLHAPLCAIDIGRMNDIYFLNVSGTGLDTEVLVQAEKYKRDHMGLGVYLRGVRDAIRFFQPTSARVGFDGAEPEERRFSILSIGNGRYFGGGMKPVPTAVLNDGLFDVVVTRPVKKWMIGFLLMLFVPGWYAKTFLAKTFRCKSVRIVAPGMTLNLDGELIRCDDARFELLPARLNVRVPGL